MKTQDFIIQILSQWHELFEGISIRYAYDKSTNFHIVEVSPEQIRQNSSAYKNAELDLWLKFLADYPTENLLISEPSAINDMSNLLYSNMVYDRKEKYLSPLNTSYFNLLITRDLCALNDQEYEWGLLEQKNGKWNCNLALAA